MTGPNAISDNWQDRDYDGAWKETLQSHYAECVWRFFPLLFLVIDWSVAPVWLDREISQILGEEQTRNPRVDLVCKVRLLNGQDLWVVCHLEVQSNYESNLPERLSLYNAGLTWLFKQQVLSLVLLADINPNWRPESYHYELGGFSQHTQFATCKLLDHLDTDWADDNSLPVLVARAQIAALRTASDPEKRYDAKRELVRQLYRLGVTSDQAREIFRLIDWMMHLRRDLEERLNVEIKNIEQEQVMPYVTAIERFAQERGHNEG